MNRRSLIAVFKVFDELRREGQAMSKTALTSFRLGLVLTLLMCRAGSSGAQAPTEKPPDAAEKALRALVTAADVVFSVHLQPELPRLGCNRQQLESAVLNLVRNSNDAISGG